MRTPTLASFFVLTILGLAATPAAAQEKTFSHVGVMACAKCHKTEKIGNQFGVWQGTKHSKAYEALTTPRADSIATAKGLTTKAAEARECLECHTTGGPDSDTPKTEGVNCEACHGPGSGYRTLAIMKDKTKAVAAGLKVYADATEIETQCRTCHNERSPTAKPFVFAERWAEVKHMRPVE
ncbi:MAG TPA: cytochrome c family protein [Gemmatimonadales bacterium]|jgi:hypothetical protein|nr:cytochrome c family protein [Gemmatimonadales bacterium]